MPKINFSRSSGVSLGITLRRHTLLRILSDCYVYIRRYWVSIAYRGQITILTLLEIKPFYFWQVLSFTLCKFVFWLGGPPTSHILFSLSQCVIFFQKVVSSMWIYSCKNYSCSVLTQFAFNLKLRNYSKAKMTYNYTVTQLWKFWSRNTI